MCEMVNRDTLLDKEEEERDADRTKDEELAAQISFKVGDEKMWRKKRKSFLF